MGLFDFLSRKIQCPSCGTPGARESGGQIRCPNPSCPYFDSSLGGVATASKAGPPAAARKHGEFSPAQPLSIRYRNFQGQETTFTADAGSARRKRKHISVRVAPTGQRITLSRDRIQNLGEVENFVPQPVAPSQAWPTRVECQVMGYHKKHGTTSPLYEKIRAKYPNW